ncbi:MAG: hypothetical protein ACI845_003005 [Gammaproteobacteria bacterium]|jgi:hypothetical protein
MLIAIPSSAVIMGIVLITLAIQSETGLVVDDYYKQGKEINRVLKRDIKAAQLKLVAEIEFNHQTGIVKISLDSPLYQYSGETILLKSLNATRAGFDQTIELAPVGNHRFVNHMTPLQEGRWYIQLETDDWRLTGNIRAPATHQITLSTDP